MATILLNVVRPLLWVFTWALVLGGSATASSLSQPAWISVALENEWGDKLSVQSDKDALKICIELDGKKFLATPRIVGDYALKSGGVQLEWGFVGGAAEGEGENWRIVSLTMIVDMTVQEFEYSFSPSKGLCEFNRKDMKGNSLEFVDYCKPAP